MVQCSPVSSWEFTADTLSETTGSPASMTKYYGVKYTSSCPASKDMRLGSFDFHEAHFLVDIFRFFAFSRKGTR